MNFPSFLTHFIFLIVSVAFTFVSLFLFTYLFLFELLIFVIVDWCYPFIVWWGYFSFWVFGFTFKFRWFCLNVVFQCFCFSWVIFPIFTFLFRSFSWFLRPQFKHQCWSQSSWRFFYWQRKVGTGGVEWFFSFRFYISFFLIGVVTFVGEFVDATEFKGCCIESNVWYVHVQVTYKGFADGWVSVQAHMWR